MLRLHRLRLREIRRIDLLDVQFDDALTVLAGGNGAGKTTLLESLIWVLFGTGMRRSEASLRRMGPDGAPAAALSSAELDFSTGSRDYLVRRTLAGPLDALVPAAELLADNVAIAQGTVQVNTAIRELTGLDRDTFVHACSTGRRELQQLVQLGPAERLHMLAHLFGSGRGAPAASVPEPLQQSITALEAEVATADERLRALETAPDLLAQYTAELEQLLPQLAEADAEFERVHDAWAGKRQDVATRLSANRMRGDELRSRIEQLSGSGGAGLCPTCGQPLGSAADGLVGRLDDEHYINAQDAKWLLQRQAQLEQRPPDLAAAETRRARLRAAVGDRTDRVARCEQAMQELWTIATERQRAGERLEALRQQAQDAARTSGAPPSAQELRVLEQTASALLARITAHHYTGLRMHGDGRIYAMRGAHPAPVVSGGDEDLIALVLRLAAMHLAPGQERLRLLLLDEPFGSLDAARQPRAIAALRDLFGQQAQLVLCTREPRFDSGTRVQLDAAPATAA